MKKSQPQLFIIIKNSLFLTGLMVWAALSGCGKQLYSHQQVMQSYHTKDEVMRQFDQPDEIIEGRDTTQWLYNCTSGSSIMETGTKVKVDGVYDASAGITVLPKAVKQFTRHRRYVIFSFDKNGKVLNWDSSGVNFVQRQMRPIDKIGMAVSVISAGCLLIASIMFLSNGGAVFHK